MKKIIHAELIKLGCPVSILGFEYITKALELISKNPLIMHSMTKELYPQVAKSFGTTASRVERAIRHAVESMWTKNNERYSELFESYDGEKPTNSEFVGMLKLVLEDSK